MFCGAGFGRGGASWGPALGIWALAGVLVLGCEDDPKATPASTTGDVTTGDTLGQDACKPANKHEVFGTYNAGLAYNFVGHAKQRRQQIADTLAKAEADVLCLQEVWLDDDVTLITGTAKATYPHSYWVKTTDPGVGGPAACSPTDAEPLKACVEGNCLDAEVLADCALDKCKAQYDAASPGCKQCLAANIAFNNVGAIFQACALGSASYAFDGRNGVVLLSKTKLEQTEVLEFESFLNKRVALHARTQTAAGPVHVFCTHLTAGLGSVNYSGKFGSWEKEQAQQIDQLTAWAKQKSGIERGVVMGDMNCGPAGDGLDAEFPQNYQKFVDAGLKAPYLAEPKPPCTWCGDNPLVGGGTSRVIDHVLLLGSWPNVTTSRKRLHDQTISVQVGGKPVQTTLSDHYGAQLTVTTSTCP